jgi:hypothetical protein
MPMTRLGHSWDSRLPVGEHMHNRASHCRVAVAPTRGVTELGERPATGCVEGLGPMLQDRRARPRRRSGEQLDAARRLAPRRAPDREIADRRCPHDAQGRGVVRAEVLALVGPSAAAVTRASCALVMMAGCTRRRGRSLARMARARGSDASGGCGAAGLPVLAGQHSRQRALRANPAGAVRDRLAADESDVDHLVLAGDWTRKGIDGGRVEAAIPSGVQAADVLIQSGTRMLGGEPSTHTLFTSERKVENRRSHR